jgi:hypothetical protein
MPIYGGLKKDDPRYMGSIAEGAASSPQKKLVIHSYPQLIHRDVRQVLEE